MNPIIENISFDGEQYTFANNPIGLTADDLYAAMIGFWTGGILGGGSETIVDVNTTARLNTMMGNVRQNGESMGVSERNIRLAQDLSLLSKQTVGFTEGQTQVNVDGSIVINKDSASPMQDVVAVMKGMGLMSQTKSKTQNKNTKTTTYTYEQLKTMSGAQVKAAYAEMVSKYAETLKKIGFTDEQVKGYVHEALKTKTAENRISSVMRLQEEMGVEGDAPTQEISLSDEVNATGELRGSEESGTIQENENLLNAVKQLHECIKTLDSTSISNAIKDFSFDTIKGKEVVSLLNEIARNSNLSVEERFNLQQQLYHSAKDLTDVLVIKDISFVDKNYRIKWPEHEGFQVKDGKVDKKAVQLTKGTVFDRYGDANGQFASPVQNGVSVTFENRSLPFIKNMQAYHKYEVLRDFSELADAIENCRDEQLKNAINIFMTDRQISDVSVFIGNIASAFGSIDGGGIQVEFPISLKLLEALDFINEIK